MLESYEKESLRSAQESDAQKVGALLAKPVLLCCIAVVACTALTESARAEWYGATGQALVPGGMPAWAQTTPALAQANAALVDAWYSDKSHAPQPFPESAYLRSLPVVVPTATTTLPPTVAQPSSSAPTTAATQEPQRDRCAGRIAPVALAVSAWASGLAETRTAGEVDLMIGARHYPERHFSNATPGANLMWTHALGEQDWEIGGAVYRDSYRCDNVVAHAGPRFTWNVNSSPIRAVSLTPYIGVSSAYVRSAWVGGLRVAAEFDGVVVSLSLIPRMREKDSAVVALSVGYRF